MPTFFEKVNELFATGDPFVAVTIVDTQGSVPQDAGSKMLVTKQGLYHGTVGGGKVEKRAIEEALQLMETASGTQKTHFVNWSLSKDIGMTCGGSVKLYFELYHIDRWKIAIFGAGHVANALIPLLLNLDCHVYCFDTRQEWLDKLPQSDKLIKKLSTNLPSEVKGLTDDTFVVLMTMGHSTDKPILLEILSTSRKFPYLGVIGSDAKAARLRKDILEAGLPENLQKAFYCPIGIQIGTNHPHEIAISVAAQLIQDRDKVKK
jgi:xanthine dehydrogenase accessory factor